MDLQKLLQGAGNAINAGVQGVEHFLAPPSPVGLNAPASPAPSPQQLVGGIGQMLSPLANTIGQGLYSFGRLSLNTNPILQQALPDHYQGPHNYNPLPDMLSAGKGLAAGYGALVAPESAALGGLFGAGMQAGSNLIHQNPLTQNLLQASGQGINFGAMLGPLNEIAGAAPGVNRIPQFVPGQGTIQNIIGKALQGGVKQALTGGLYGALNNQNPLTTAASFAPYGLMEGLAPTPLNESQNAVGVNPHTAFSIDRETMKDLEATMERVQSGKPLPTDLPKIQEAIEDYAPGYKNAETPIVLKTLRAIMDRNTVLPEGVTPAPFPKLPGGLRMSLVGDQPPAPEGNPEPLPWETSKPGPQFAGQPIPQPEEPKPMTTGALLTNEKGNTEFTPPPEGTGDVQGALHKYFGTQQGIEQDTTNLRKQATRVLKTEEDQKLFRTALEEPAQVEQLAAQSSNPSKFKELVTAHQDYTDRIYALAQRSGKNFGYIKDYYTHIIDRTDPEAEAKLEQLFLRKAANAHSYFENKRIVPTIAELEAMGIHLKNPTVAQDVQQYGNSARRSIGAASLFKGLNEARPGEIASINESGGISIGPDGRPMVPLKIPGLEGTAVSQDLYKQHLANLEPKNFGSFIGTMDKANRAVKEIKLGGGLFHALNTSLDYVGNKIGHLQIPRIDQAVHYFFSPGDWTDYMQGKLEDGTIQRMSDAGVTLSKAPDLLNDSSVLQNVSSKNPLTLLKQATFSRLINYYKIDTWNMMEKGGLGTENPEQTQQVAKVINYIFGGQNHTVGDSVFKSPAAQKAISFLALAPDYQEGRFGRTAMAGDIRSFDPAHNLARVSLAGRILATAVIAELGRRLVTGNFDPDIKSMVQNAILNPTIPAPFTNPKGNKQQITLPGSNVTDIYRAAGQGQTGIEHSLISHLAALPSAYTQYVTNKSYYDVPLADPFQGPVTPARKLAALGMANLPIPVTQGINLAQGKVNLPAAALNTIGLRVSTDPNSPSVVYAQTKSNLVNQLNPNQQAVFNTISPQTKDMSGNPIDVTKPDAGTKAKLLLDNWAALYPVMKQLDGTESVHNPVFALPENQAKSYYQFVSMDPKQRATYGASNPQIYDTMRSVDAYNQQIAQATGGKGTPNPIYKFPTQQIADYYTWEQMASGTQKADFSANHPWVYDMRAAMQPYYDSLPAQAGQPKTQYDPTKDPIYSLPIPQRAVALAYTAYSDNKMTAQKQQLLAQNPWLPAFWNQRSAYFNSLPAQTNTAQQQSPGLGLNFATPAYSGGSSSGGPLPTSIRRNVMREFRYTTKQAGKGSANRMKRFFASSATKKAGKVRLTTAKPKVPKLSMNTMTLGVKTPNHLTRSIGSV